MCKLMLGVGEVTVTSALVEIAHYSHTKRGAQRKKDRSWNPNNTTIPMKDSKVTIGFLITQLEPTVPP